jgi:hypothetical protein
VQKVTKSRPQSKANAKRKTGRAQTTQGDAARASRPPAPKLDVDDFPELPALVHYVRQRRCTLFVGAGLSKGAGLPSWRELMEQLVPAATPFAVAPDGAAAIVQASGRETDMRLAIEKALGAERSAWFFRRSVGRLPGGDPGTSTSSRNLSEIADRIHRDTLIASELQKLMKADKFAEVAGFCRDLLGREQFHEQVRKELLTDCDIPATHRAIVRTPWASIVTTNFDNLLERAYKEWEPRGVPKAPTGAELSQQGTLLLDDAFFILKAHGDLDDESSIVFTSEDYRRVIHSNPAFQAMLAGVLLTRAVLFVGYSLSDPNFRLLLDNQLTIFKEEVPPRYALMDGVGDAEREILWRTAKLRVFSYEQGRHEVVERFLNTLADRAGNVRSEPTNTVTSSHENAAAIPRQPLNRLADIKVATLAIHAAGDRITLDLYEPDALGSPRRTWSGGHHWPEWSTLKYRLTEICGTSDAKLAGVSAFGALLQKVIPADLQDQLDVLHPDTTVALSLSPETEIVPWEWLIVEGSPLCLRNPVIRRPVGVSDKARGLRFAGTPIRALIVGDAGIGDGTNWPLPGAEMEVRELATLLQMADARNVVRLLLREEAVYARLVEEVDSGDYDIIHFAGHAWYEQSQALLYLWDGRVTSSELSSLLNRRPPALLFLNSHYTAFVPCGIASYDYSFERWEKAPYLVRAPGVDRPAPSALGFTCQASRSGVGAFVGSFAGALHDGSAAAFALEFYKQLLNGWNFASALHSARKATTRFDDITGTFYTGTGYPGLLLTPAPR